LELRKDLGRIVLLTGIPGVGKTTVLKKSVDALKAKGFMVGGMLSQEVRSGGSRVGFEILSVDDDKRGWLAHMSREQGPRVGKYRVDLDDLSRVGVAAIVKAAENCDAIVIDEVGPMEMYSDDFKQAVLKAIQSTKFVICTVHWHAKGFWLERLKKIEDVHLIEVTLDNREGLHELIVKDVTEFMRERTKQ
jgi:nucleoside-triphosphatase